MLIMEKNKRGRFAKTWFTPYVDASKADVCRVVPC